MNDIDTSVLLKWYLPARGSDAVGAWMATLDEARISVLTRVEVRTALARRQRDREVGAADARRAADAFLADLDDGPFVVHRTEEQHGSEAETLLTALAADDVARRTVDTLHLACARVEQDRVFATADRRLAAAARPFGLQTPTFD